jgi:hypothetical protein
LVPSRTGETTSRLDENSNKLQTVEAAITREIPSTGSKPFQHTLYFVRLGIPAITVLPFCRCAFQFHEFEANLKPLLEASH